MYKLTGPIQNKEVTPKEAESFLAINNFAGQRKLNVIKARRYADMMDTGEMRPVDIAIMTLPNGQRQLVNGQHVCHGIMLRGKPYKAVVSYYRCEELKDAWRLFSTFDSHATRTERQIMGGARGAFEDSRLHDIALRTLQSCGSALVALGDGLAPNFKNKVGDKKAKVEAVENHPEEVACVSFIIGSETRSHLARVGVVAAIIATLRANEKMAFKFWESVRTGELLVSTDPEYQLRKHLLSGEARIASSSGGGCDMNRYWFILSICWWNSWMNNEQRRSVKVLAVRDYPEVETVYQPR